MRTNNQISKFFNVDAPEVATGGGMNIAEMMAKQGTVNNGEVGLTQPINITPPEKKDPPPPATEPAPAATATPDSPAERPQSEPPSPEAKVEDAPKPQIAAEPPKTQSWQEVLKSQQPDTVLKELGYNDSLVKFLSGLKEVDPKVVNFLNTWKDGGDLKGYLKEWTTDYSQMPAEEVMRHHLRQEYPKASDAQIETLYKREVVKAYSLDSDDEAEVAEGKLLLEAKADKFRDTFTDNQKNYLFPAKPEPKAAEPDLSEIQAKQDQESYRATVQNSPYTKDIFANSKFSFGEGEDKFTYPVDPKAVSNVLFNDAEWAQGMFATDVNEKGEITKIHYDKPDVEKQMLIALVHKHGKDVFVKMAQHYKNLGGKAVNDLIENASLPDGQQKPNQALAPPKTPAEAMAREGRLV